MKTLYLTRRNLLTLLSKLDRMKAGEKSAGMLLKRDTSHPVYPTSNVTMVVALEDEDYYTDRKSGRVHPSDLSPKSAQRLLSVLLGKGK